MIAIFHDLIGLNNELDPIIVTAQLQQSNLPSSCKLVAVNGTFDEVIFKNLPYWVSQSYEVLWQIHPLGKRISLFENSTIALSQLLNESLQLTNPLEATRTMLLSLSRSHFFIEKVIFKIEGNWLLKNRNKRLNGLTEYFLFYLSSIDTELNEDAKKCLKVFVQRFGYQVDLSPLFSLPSDKVITALVRCFYKQINDLKTFQSVLAEA